MQWQSAFATNPSSAASCVKKEEGGRRWLILLRDWNVCVSSPSGRFLLAQCHRVANDLLTSKGTFVCLGIVFDVGAARQAAVLGELPDDC
jgi:hypothetical protein